MLDILYVLVSMLQICIRQVSASAFTFGFSFKLSASVFSFSFYLQLQISASHFSFMLQFPGSASSFKFQLQLSASASSFGFKLRLSNSALSCSFILWLSKLNMLNKCSNLSQLPSPYEGLVPNITGVNARALRCLLRLQCVIYTFLYY